MLIELTGTYFQNECCPQAEGDHFILKADRHHERSWDLGINVNLFLKNISGKVFIRYLESSTFTTFDLGV